MRTEGSDIIEVFIVPTLMSKHAEDFQAQFKNMWTEIKITKICFSEIGH